MSWAESGQPPEGQQGQPQPKPNTYLVPSILVTIFCCLPVGIPAIVFSAMSSSDYSNGDAAEGARKAEIAKKLSIAAVATAGVFILLYVMWVVFVAGSAFLLG